MDSPVRKYQKEKDYQRHKLFRKIKRRRVAELELTKDAPMKVLRRKLGVPKFKKGKEERDLKFVGDNRIVDDLGNEMLVYDDTIGEDPANWTYMRDADGAIYKPSVPTNNGTIQQGNGFGGASQLAALSNQYRWNPILGAPARFIDGWRNGVHNAIGLSPLHIAMAAAPFMGAGAMKLRRPNMGNMSLQELGDFFAANPEQLENVAVRDAVRKFYANDVIPRLAKMYKRRGKELNITADDLINGLTMRAGDFGNNKYGGYYNADQGVVLNKKVLDDPELLSLVQVHELRHALDNIAPNTPEGQAILEAAYKAGVNPATEMVPSNTEVRSAISSNYNDSYGKALDAIMKGLSEDQLNTYYTGPKANAYNRRWAKYFLPGMASQLNALTAVANPKDTTLIDSIGYKKGKLPKYEEGKKVITNGNPTHASFNSDGTFTDDTTKVFDDFYVTPQGVKTKYGSYTDKNWDRYKQQEAFFRTHDQQTGNIKYEPGLEIVSPEFDILTLGAGARTNTATQTFLKNRKIANAIAKGIKENAIITGYNRNPVTKELGTLWDYQSYLDNVFPNSKIKDVLWHGSIKKNLLSFSPEYIGSNTPIKKSVGMYLAPEKITAANYGRKGDIYPVLLNTENPFVTNQFFGGISKNGINITRISPKTRSTILANNDAVIAPTRGEIAFFEPNNALILGSKRDVEGFREFMSKPSIKLSANADIAKDPYINAISSVGKTSFDIAKESPTVYELNKYSKMLDPDGKGNRISGPYASIKKFLESPAYRKRLEKYYRDKGSSIITQNVAPDDRISELLYNIETAKLKVMPRGKLIDEVGNVKDSFGLYDPNSHSIQIASDAIFRLTPEHEMWHAARRARAYLDNAKYSMKTRALDEIDEMFEKILPREFNSQELKELEKDAMYFSNMSEQEVRVLDTLREMQESGLDINNLSDDLIWEFFFESPIDSHGTNVLSLILNYVYDDIKNALRNFKSLLIPSILGTGIATSEYKYGKSGIHIKPANRGKFTALKKRTGHSASWFKAHGTPAQKKMATFALNSKHWAKR